MFLNATKEVQVKPYDRGKFGTNGLKPDSFDDATSRSYSPSSKPKLSVNEYHFLENKGNYRPGRKRDAIPKIERELSEAYIDTITRTPRYGLGRHKTYDEILLSMSNDDPFGQKYQPSAIQSNEQNSTQKSKSSEQDGDSSSAKPISKTTAKEKDKSVSEQDSGSSSVKPISKTTAKEKDKSESFAKQTSTSRKIKKENQMEESPRKEIDKEAKDKKKEDTKSSLKSPTQKQSSDDKVKEKVPAEKFTQNSATSGTPRREISNVSNGKQSNKSNRNTSPKKKKKSAKKSTPRKSRIPVLLPSLFNRTEDRTCSEYKYQPLGIVKTKNSKIPVMKQHSIADIEKRITLVTTNKRLKEKLNNNKTSGHAVVLVSRKTPDLTADGTLSNSPGRSIESHVYGSSLVSPWRRAGSAQGARSHAGSAHRARSNHSMYPINVPARNTISAMSPEIDNMSYNEYKSMTLNECDHKELKEMTARAFGQKSKTMFMDKTSTFGNQEPIMTPKRDPLQPKLERELSDAYIESISRTPRYGLGRHKTYDEILTSMSQADPFNGNYQPSGINPREKTNMSLKRTPDTNQSTEHVVQSKSKG